MAIVPRLLQRRGTDEYIPPAPTPGESQSRQMALDTVTDRSAERGVNPTRVSVDRTGTAIALAALDASAGGGFFVIDDSATHTVKAADEFFDDADGPPVVDVQTHIVNPGRYVGSAADALSWFLGFADADRWGGGVDPQLLSPATWSSLVFGQSETAAALITLPPGAGDARVIDNDEVAVCRELVDSIAGPGRVLSHSIVHPNLDGDLAAMEGWRDRCAPSGWKVYPLFGEDGGWRLDDETGSEFLDRVEKLGPRLVAAHKGISGPAPDAAPAGAAPHDVGPAAAAHPNITFLIYHSGYEPMYTEDAYGETRLGVDALITSLASAGIDETGNVYAELGSTWQLILRKPVEAAHVLGKLLLAVGPNRILWGTDSVWYGSPQPLIDAFRSFQIPPWMRDEYGYPELTVETKRRVLSTNAARVYGIEPAPRDDAWIEFGEERLRRVFD